MSAISLFDTFYRMGMTKEEAFAECEKQHMYTVAELQELAKYTKK